MSDEAVPSRPVLLTVILKHDEAIDLEERNRILSRKGWWDRFPPEGCTVVDWYFAMGLGHLLVLSVPPEKIPELNVEVQRSCWGAYGTEFYLSYDFKPLREQIASRNRRDG